MLIHLYTTIAPGYPRDTPRDTHIGHGLGSLFGKLFSRIGRTVAKSSIKTAIKSVAKTGAQIGKKALSSAVKKAAPLAKEALKEGITSATNFGAEKAIQGIQNLAEKSIKHGAPESLAHSLAKAAEKGAKAVTTGAQKSIVKQLDGLAVPFAPPAPAPKKGSKRKGTIKSSKVSHRKRKKTTANLLDEI